MLFNRQTRRDAYSEMMNAGVGTPQPTSVTPTSTNIDAAAEQMAQRRSGLGEKLSGAGKGILGATGAVGKGIGRFALDVGKNLAGDADADGNFTFNPKIRSSDILGIMAGRAATNDPHAKNAFLGSAYGNQSRHMRGIEDEELTSRQAKRAAEAQAHAEQNKGWKLENTVTADGRTMRVLVNPNTGEVKMPDHPLFAKSPEEEAFAQTRGQQQAAEHQRAIETERAINQKNDFLERINTMITDNNNTGWGTSRNMDNQRAVNAFKNEAITFLQSNPALSLDRQQIDTIVKNLNSRRRSEREAALNSLKNAVTASKTNATDFISEFQQNNPNNVIANSGGGRSAFEMGRR